MEEAAVSLWSTTPGNTKSISHVLTFRRVRRRAIDIVICHADFISPSCRAAANRCLLISSSELTRVAISNEDRVDPAAIESRVLSRLKLEK